MARIDLGRVVSNARAIRRAAGVEVWAVVKADAYGLGAARVVRALAGEVDGFCVFSLEEAVAAEIWPAAGKPTIALGPPSSPVAEDYAAVRVRPAVWTIEQAAALRSADPLLSLDTGMQRFACPPAEASAVLAAGGIREAFTHAVRPEQARLLAEALGGRGLKLHAAASSLLDDPECRLDAVRPGLALYRGAVRVWAELVEVRQGAGPAGYSGFRAERHGIILAGYAHGVRPGPCLIGGQRRRIIEVGMQSAYIELGPADRAGDEVVLLGDGLSEDQVAAAWRCSPHEVLVQTLWAARKHYRGP